MEYLKEFLLYFLKEKALFNAIQIGTKTPKVVVVPLIRSRNAENYARQ